jgi:hypothetical protein
MREALSSYLRFIERAGTPSQISWIDLGLRALTGAPLTDQLKIAVLLLLSGYVSSQARLVSTAVEGTRLGLFGGPAQATEVIGDLLRTVVSADRFPALHAALIGGAFAPVKDPTYAPFEFGLDLILDGIDQLMKQQAPPSATPA